MQQKPSVLGLFSGIGGFELGLQWAGFETKAMCENDPFCRQVLAKHWPDVPIHEDITKLDGKQYEGTIDLVCGGFPCQSFSLAGKRRGKEDDRYLWPEMLRVIAEVGPTWVIGENVTGIKSMEFDRTDFEMVSRTGGRNADGVDYQAVSISKKHMQLGRICKDLRDIGYDTTVFLIPACGVGAPHLRERVWIVAHTDRTGSGTPRREANESRSAIITERKEQPQSQPCGPCARFFDKHQCSEFLGECDCPRCQGYCECSEIMANPSSGRCGEPGGGEGEQPRRAEAIGGSEDVADAKSNECNGIREARETDQGLQAGGCDCASGARNGRFVEPGLGRMDARTSDGIHGYQWPDEPAGVPRIATGIPNRNERLKALGNMVVPANVYPLGLAIMDIRRRKGVR